MNDIIRVLKKDPSLTRRLLEVHLAKPQKVDLFYRAFQKFTKTNTLKYSISFSFWGFLGKFWFYIYRKMYAQAAMFFFLPWTFFSLVGFLARTIISIDGHSKSLGFMYLSFSIVSTIILIVLTVLPGFAGIYLYIRKFLNDLAFAGFKTRKINEGFEANLSMLGGYNKWALMVPVVLTIISLAILAIFAVMIYLHMDSLLHIFNRLETSIT